MLTMSLDTDQRHAIPRFAQILRHSPCSFLEIGSSFLRSPRRYYIFCTWLFTTSFITNFVVILVLNALDFWVVKNVSGRLLVGLRWWNEVSPDNDSTWKFESLATGDRQISPSDARYFWWSLYATPVAWLIVGLSALFNIGKWDYLLIVIIAIAMSSSNIVGYYKCSGDQQQKLKDLTNNAMQSAVSAGMRSAMNNYLGGGQRAASSAAATTGPNAV